MFSNVDYSSSSDYVTFVLANGTELKVPTWSAFEALKQQCEQMNSNIVSLQTIVEGLQENDYITSVTPIYEGGKEVGYIIIFAKFGKVTIYHGKDGQNGSNGQDGAPGQNGSTPVIGVKKDTDGVYYWTLNGDWMRDKDGNKIPTTGKDGTNGSNGSNGQDGANGADGAPGAAGKDGVTPQLKIEDGKWYVSYESGAEGSWIELGQATGDQGPQGNTGATGPQGPQGEAGVAGDSMFEKIDTSDQNYVIMLLSNGTTIMIPTWYAFEELKQQCEQMNTNISSLQTIVDALQENDYVTGVVDVKENGMVIGYTITFSKERPVTIYHGKDGADGTPGKDGVSPVIGVREVNGVWYWTLDGELMLDTNGNEIPTTGTDGTNGKDGVTPVLKIEDGYWYISYEGGADGSWVKLGQATGDKGDIGQTGPQGPTGATGPQGPAGENGLDGDSWFSGVDTSSSDYITITLNDGNNTQIVLPRYKALGITFYNESSVKLDGPVAFQPGATHVIKYAAEGSGTVKVAVVASNGWTAIISRDDEKNGSIKITAPEEYVESEVVVFVNNASATLMETVAFMQPPVNAGAEHDGFEGDTGNPGDAW